jgi:glucan 1,3-beta-glucosidase
MRVSTILPAALAAAPLAVSAAGTLGFALGARMPSELFRIQGPK